MILEDGTAEITGYLTERHLRPAQLLLPSVLGGMPVTAIGDDALFNATVGVDSVIIPEGVVRIGESAFSNGKFSSVTLPSTLQTIDDYAFFSCTNLTRVTLPEGVTTIGSKAFAWCEVLLSVNLPDSILTIGDNPFSACYKLAGVTMSPEHPTLAIIDQVLYSKADKRLVWYPRSKLGDPFVIPTGIRIIGADAFCASYDLRQVVIPDTVTTIGDSAFYSCAQLTEITLPDSVVCVGPNPFTRCGSITTVNVSPTHPVLECIDGVLYDKAERRLISCYTVPDDACIVADGTLSIGPYAFQSAAPRSITFPESVTSIADNAFYNAAAILFTVPYDSFAEAFCEENGYSYNHPDALDWLME